MSKCRKLPLGSSPETFSPDVVADISELFAKNFSYGKPLNSEWPLPDPTEILLCLQHLKQTILVSVFKDCKN